MTRTFAGTGLSLQPIGCGTHPLLIDLLEHQRRATPDATAIDDGALRWTYRQLFAAADVVAGAVRDRHMGPGDRVGLCHGRSAAAVAGIIGILRAGAAYVPLDPSWPDSRLHLVAEQARLQVVLTDADQVDRMRWPVPLDTSTLQLDADPSGAEDPSAARGQGPARDDGAYVLFTSGTSGVPKGVSVSHANVAAFLDWLRHDIDPSHFALTAATMSFGFDPSIIELFGPLTTGGCVRLVRSPLALLDLDERITFLAAVPSVAAELARALRLPPTLQTLVTGGEELTAATADQLLRAVPGVRLLNTYGPTETTVMVTVHECQEPLGARLPLGRAIPGSTVVVLDGRGHQVEAGEVGEVYIGGDQVATGYLDAASTAEQFVLWTDRDGVRRRLYRTGDLAVIEDDGTLLFRGRSDDQVKVRGFRVEPTEIEAHLRQVNGVREVAVRAVTHEANVQLVAYYVPSGGPVAATVLREAVARAVPAHAVPAGYVAVDKLPVNASGKLDPSRLPDWIPSRERTTPRRARSSADAAPDEVMTAIIVVLHSVLGLTSPIVEDDDIIDDLGASSLALVQILGRLESELGVVLPLGKVLADTTVGGVADLIREARAGHPTEPQPMVWNATGTGTPIALFHSYFGAVLRYRQLAATLPADRPFICIHALDLDRSHPADEPLIDLATRALSQLRKVRPYGPYILGGHSIGGLIAIEVARRLRALGEVVELVVLIDTPTRGSTAQYLFAELVLNAPDFLELSWPERRARLGRMVREHLPGTQGRRAAQPATGERIETFLEGAGRRINRAVRGYRSDVYEGDVLLLRTFHGVCMAAGDPTLGWARLVGGRLTIVDVAGNHGTVLDPDNAVIVGRCLSAALVAATADGEVVDVLDEAGEA